MVTDMDVLRTSISNFAARCAEKLRKLGSQQYTKPGGKGKADVFKDSIKHETKEQREQSQARLDFAESRLRKSNAQFRSPCYTTRWSDIPEAE